MEGPLIAVRDHMTNLIYIGIGGFIGSCTRYLLSTYIANQFSNLYGTLSVNIIGSFVVGAIYSCLFQGALLSDQVKLFLIAGILGGFTTFSALSLDTLILFKEGSFTTALIYSFGQLALGLISVYAGFVLFKNALN